MQPVSYTNKIRTRSAERAALVSEVQQPKRGKSTLTLADHINKADWCQIKTLFDKSDIKQKILLFRELADLPAIPQSALPHLNQIFAPVDFSAFITDYKTDPYVAILTYLKGCSAALRKLEVESFHKKIEHANQSVQLKPDTRFFAHVFSDFIISKTPFEGGNYVISIHNLHKSLALVKVIHPEWNTNVHLQAALIQIADLAKEATQMEAISKSFSEAQFDAWAGNKVQQLKQTGQLNLPSGFSGEPAGHSMVARIWKKDSYYSIALYNTGEGLEYHKSCIIDGKEKYCTVAEWENIPATQVENKMFFKTLFGMNMIATSGHIKPTAHHLYLTLIAFAGEPKDSGEKCLDQFMAQQRSGTCAWKCLMALLRNSMPERDYKRLKLQIRLVVYVLSEKILQDPQFSEFYPQTRTKIFRSIDKLFEKQMISVQEMFRAFLVFYAQPPSLVEAEDSLILASEPLQESVPAKNNPPTATPTPFYDIKKIPSFIFTDWSRIKDAGKVLEEACTYFKDLDNEYRLTELRALLKRFLHNLPQVNHPCWKNLPLEQVELCSQNLKDLAILLIESQLEFTPEYAVNTFYLLQLHETLVIEYMNRQVGSDVFGKHRFTFAEMNKILSLPLSEANPVMIDRMHQLGCFFNPSAMKESSIDHLFFVDTIGAEELGIYPRIDFHINFEKGFAAILKLYLTALGRADEIPHDDYDAYREMLKNKTCFPEVFWNLWVHFWTCIGNASTSEENWEITGDDDSNYLAEDDEIWVRLFEEIKKANIPLLSAIKPVPFYYQIPAVVDQLCAKTELLNKQDMQVLTISLFQCGSEYDHPFIPLMHESKQTSFPLLLFKIRNLLTKQFEFALLNREVEQLEQVYNLCCTLDHYIGGADPLFSALIEYQKVVMFYDSLDEDRKVNGGLFLLHYCQKAELINLKFLEVYIEIFFRSVSDFNREDLTECCLIGLLAERDMAELYQVYKAKLNRTFNLMTSMDGVVEGEWPVLRIADRTYDMSHGVQTTLANEMAVYLNKPADTDLELLRRVIVDDEYPLRFKVEQNRIYDPDKGIEIEYFEEIPPRISISGDRLQRLSSLPLPVICQNGYSKNAHVFPSIKDWNAFEIEAAWFAKDGSHAYIFSKDAKELFLFSQEQGRTVRRDIKRDLVAITLAQLKENRTGISKQLLRWAKRASSLWVSPKTGSVHLLLHSRYIWDPLTDSLTSDKFYGYKVSEHQFSYVQSEIGIILEKSPSDRMLVLFDPNKNRSYELKSDPDIDIIWDSFVGSPIEMMHFVSALLENHHFQTAYFYYKKLPKLLHDVQTWTTISKILIRYKEVCKTANPDFFALLTLMAYDFLENSPELNDFTLEGTLNQIYSSYLQNYTNITKTMRLSLQQEEFIQDHLEPSPLLASHLNQLKGISFDQAQVNVSGGLERIHKEMQNISLDCQLPPYVDQAKVIPYQSSHYYFDRSVRKMYADVAKTILTGIATNDKELELHGLALLAGIKADTSCHISIKKIFYFILKIVRHAQRPEIHALIKKTEDKTQSFIKLLNELFLVAQQLPMQATDVRPRAEKVNVRMHERKNLVQDKVIVFPRSQPFFKTFEEYFEAELPVDFTIEGLVSKVSANTDRLGQFFIGVLDQHSKLVPTCVYHLKEGRQKELKAILEANGSLYENFVSQKLQEYKDLLGCTFENVTTVDNLRAILQRQSKVLGGLEKDTTLEALVDQYLLNDENSSETAANAILESIICGQLHALTCRLAIKALDEGNEALAGQILRSSVYQSSGQGDFLAKVQNFYQIVSKKLFREKQWKVFDLTNLNDNLALQIDCGQGKTKVITVVLALKRLVQRKLVFNVVPVGNAEMNVCDLVSFINAKTPFRVRHFEVVRSFKTDVANLSRFVKLLNLNQQEGVALVSVPQSLQSFLLKYFEVLIEAVPISKISEHGIRLGLFEEAWEQILGHSRGIVDEGHDVLSPKRTLNYSLNNEEKGLPLERYQDMLWLYQGMEIANEQGTVFPVGAAYKADYTQEHYQAEQISYLASIWCLLFPKERQRIHALLSKKQEDLCKEDKAFFYQMEKDVQDRILRMRAQLHHYLPYTLNLRCCVHYGPLAGVKEAVPYDFNQSPLKNSKFQNPDVLINLSIQQTLQLDLTKDQVKEIIGVWQKTGIVSEDIQKICPLNILAIDIEKKDLFDQLYSFLHKNADVKREYARFCIFPTIQIQDERLSSNAQDLAALIIPHVTTFSGTLLNNLLMLPNRMRYDLDGTVDADMLRMFFLGDHVQFVVEDNLKVLLEHPKVCMVLDPNAYYEGRFNLNVASTLLVDSPDSVVAINYFDEETNLLKRHGRSNAAGREITYCDQKHTTGTDTVQPKDGIGLLIVNKGMTWTDLVQASNRLRLLGRGQKVILVVSKQIHDSISQKIPDGEFSKDKIFIWACLNEGGTIGSNFTLSLQQSLHTVCRRRLMMRLTKIRFEENSYSKRMALIAANRRLIVEKVNNHEYREHGSIEPAKTPLDHFIELADCYKTEFHELLVEEDLLEIKKLVDFATSLLSDAQGETITDRLNMHMQTEKREVRLLSEDLEVQNDADFPLITHAEPILRDRAHLGVLNSLGFQNKAYISADMMPEIGLDKRIYFTSKLVFKTLHSPADNRLSNIKLQDHRFDLYFPKIEYVMSIVDGNRKRYFTIVPKEAEVMRRFAHTHERIDEYAGLSIFNTEGQTWLDYRAEQGSEDPDIALISAQVRFINAEARYTPPQFDALKTWLKSGNLDAKIAFFMLRQTHLALTDESIRYRDPSIMQALFNECVG